MKLAAILLAVLLLFGCVPANQTATGTPETEISEPEIQEPEAPTPENTEPEVPKATEVIYDFPENAEPETVVSNYFEALYESYTAMLPVDISPVIDLDFEIMQNIQNWNTLLAMRRQIIHENNYCYVETERFPFTIEYIEKADLDDQRMDYVRLSNFGENRKVLHFVIRGEEGKAYPPIFALNSQHSVILTEKDGTYKIAYHYFPGSEGKFENDLSVELIERKDMELIIADEFSGKAETEIPESKFERIYNPENAVQYALAFCEKQNPDFYFVGDWYGNCMNFASQCIWSGFKTEDESPENYDSMTKNWHMGKSGGSLQWSSVSRFGEWILQEYCRLQTYTFYDTAKVQSGDLVHIGSYLCEIEEKYTHALFVVDEEKMVLAQNSPACFVYYSDLVNNFVKFIRPISLGA